MQTLIEAGVECVTGKGLAGFEDGAVRLECVYSGRLSNIEARQLIPISARVANDELWQVLEQRREQLNQKGLLSLRRIGDCQAPGIVAAAVYAGHKVARELGCETVEIGRDRVIV